MKTIEEFYNEAMQDEALSRELDKVYKGENFAQLTEQRRTSSLSRIIRRTLPMSFPKMNWKKQSAVRMGM